MTITTIQKPQFHSDLTGCNYDTYEEACKAEFRELLAQRLQAETALHCTVCLDLATWFANNYPDLWKPVTKLRLDNDNLIRKIAKDAGASVATAKLVLNSIDTLYNVTVVNKS